MNNIKGLAKLAYFKISIVACIASHSVFAVSANEIASLKPQEYMASVDLACRKGDLNSLFDLLDSGIRKRRNSASTKEKKDFLIGIVKGSIELSISLVG